MTEKAVDPIKTIIPVDPVPLPIGKPQELFFQVGVYHKTGIFWKDQTTKYRHILNGLTVDPGATWNLFMWEIMIAVALSWYLLRQK